MRDGAAEGAAVPDLRVTDPGGDVRQQRHLGLRDLGGLQVVVPGAGADRDLVAVHPHVVQLGDPGDVDEHRRDRQPQLHDRQQRVPAGQDLGVLAVLGQGGDRLVDGRHAHVVELRRDHALTSCWDEGTWPAAGPASAALRTACTMLW